MPLVIEILAQQHRGSFFMGHPVQYGRSGIHRLQRQDKESKSTDIIHLRPI